MTLADLKVGQRAMIVGFASELDMGLPRLMSMGLLPAQPVTVLRRAPLGDPLQVKVGNTTLSLRSSEAQQIHIGELND